MVLGLAVALGSASCGDDGTAVAPTTVPVTIAGVPTDHGLDDETLAAVLASTTAVDGVACGRLASGSGFAVTEDLVVTSAHVVVGIDEIRVHTFDGRTLAATPVAFDPDADLAIVRVDGAGLTPLPLAADAAPGTTGVVVGWERGPFADPTPYRVQRRVTVRIERVGDTVRIERPAWLVAAEIDVGDSGAALVDRTGEVIGVAFATSTAGDGIGYAVRSSAVGELLAGGLDDNPVIPDC
jgi:S1-C subfamily serine protease